MTLDEKCIECICKMLLLSPGNQKMFKQFSQIINNLCNNQSNLIVFLKYIKGFIKNVTQEINSKFNQGSTEYDEIFKGEKALINIFQFIKDLNERENTRSEVNQNKE